ncbi:MAG: CvpA family protein [Candidatus Omnitrophica bacterium]|nr:CvpA family protein [Candidatus Omnitrophota bacterium]
MGYVGFREGLSAELVRLSGLGVGLCVSFRYYQAAGDFVGRWLPLPIEWVAVLAMAGLAVLVYFCVTRGLRFMEKLVKVTFQAQLNQVGGCLGGIARAAVAISLILVIFEQLPSEYLKTSIEERSFSGRPLSRVAPAVYDGAVVGARHLLAALRPKTG